MNKSHVTTHELTQKELSNQMKKPADLHITQIMRLINVGC